MREDIEFEEELRPEVIGKGGSNMREAKTASGCCYLDVVRGENYAVVVGTEDQIDIARQCVFSSFSYQDYPHVILIELRQALISYQDYRMLF